MSFEVLFVCTGNICRSPMGERLLRARLPADVPVRVSSAGTSGLTGWAMDRPSARALREVGGDPDGHCARLLTPELVDGADLVLTAERAHRDLIVRADPGAAGRIHTVREFGHFGAGLGPLPQPSVAALRQRVAEIDQRRAVAAPLPPDLADIGDPYGARAELVRACARLVSESVDAVLEALGLGAAVPSGSPA